MGKEIERKFRVTGEPWRGAGDAVRVRQGYLCVGPYREWPRDQGVKGILATEATELTEKMIHR